MAVVFHEGVVEADRFHIRYMEAGEGTPLVHLHGAGGLRLNPSHDLLAGKFRVIALEMPGFGASAENTRTANMQELAATIAKATDALGLERFNLMGTSFGGRVALWLAADMPERVFGLVLESPAAIAPADGRPPSRTPAEMARLLFAHPERMPPLPAGDPQQAAQTQAFVRRVFGPARDPDLEARMRNLKTPTLVVFGTLDAMIPPDFGRIYKQLIPDCYLVFVYDAGHAVGTERPEAFVEVVGDFLDRHEAFVVSRVPTVLYP